MKKISQIHLIILLFALICTYPAGADDGCRDDLMEISAMRTTVQTTPKLRRDLHFLRQAASLLHKRGKEEECEETVEAMRDLLSEHVERQEHQQRLEYLSMAEKLSEVRNTIAVENITGSPVYNLNGEDLGNIESMVINTHTGTVAHAVLSYGGFIGFGQKNIAIAWDALKLTPDRESYVVDISIDELNQAPELDADSLPDDIDLDWLKF